MKNLDMLHKGDFNDMSQERQPDGTVILTLHKRKGNVHRRFRVRNLNQPGEEEVDLATGKSITRGNIQSAVSKVSTKSKGDS